MLSPTVKLNSGHDMPLVGFGCWKVNNDTCADQIYNAIKVGYRLFDGACDYGNERECGEGVARAIKDGLVTRSDLFIVSKLWCTYHEKERVPQACKKSLEDWGLDYFDLYLVHFPVALKYVDFGVKYPPELEDEFGVPLPFGHATNQETWTAMEALVDPLGWARSIGVSNYNSQSIMDLLRYARIKPATLQIEHHPYLAQTRLLKYATDNKIQVTAYSSFGPASFVELHFKMAQTCGPLLEDGGVKKIAERHGKNGKKNITSAQVLLRWATQRGVAVIPKSNHPTRLKENLDCCTFDLAEGDMEYLNGLDRGLRFNDFVHYGYNIPVFA